MKRLLAIALALVMVFVLVAACGDADDPVVADPTPTPPVADDAPEPDDDPAPPEEDDPAPADVAGPDLRVALIAHSPESLPDDGSFNAGAWIGVENFIAQHNIPSENIHFFIPREGTIDGRIDLIENAIEEWGADVLVLPGFHFVEALYTAQDIFPDTYFIFLDGVPAPEGGGDRRTADNLVSILYAEHESGFLAGYAAVKEGFRDLGFMGGVAVPAVVRFGHGFIQGADFAAAELGLSEGDVTIRYHYVGGFAPDPAVTTLAGSWFAGGTEVIFAAAGGAGGSVMAAAEAENGVVIGVDLDQANDSPTVITSAMKELAISVSDMLNAILNGTFPGGSVVVYDAVAHGVGLPMATSRFNNFTQADYDAIFAQLSGGAINVNDSLEMGDITTALVTVIEQ